MPTALVVEDDESNSKVLGEILEYHGYRVFSASAAAGALGVCRDNRIDILVADIVLRSAVSGVDIALKVRRQDPRVCILFVSGTPLEGWSDHDFSALETLLPGRVKFLFKPFTADEFNAAIEEVCGRAYSGEAFRKQVELAKRFRVRETSCLRQ